MSSASEFTPQNIPLVPRPTKYAKKKQASSTSRGYGVTHRKQRLQVLAEQPICARCGAAWSEQLHHKDRNPQNRQRSNVEGLCGPCHRKEHQ